VIGPDAIRMIKINRNEMGGTCSRLGIWEMHRELKSKNMKGRDHLEHVGVNGLIIWKWNLTAWCEDVHWIHLAPSVGHWQVHVDRIMSLPFP
jgi:hypothetical protein